MGEPIDDWAPTPPKNKGKGSGAGLWWAVGIVLALVVLVIALMVISRTSVQRAGPSWSDDGTTGILNACPLISLAFKGPDRASLCNQVLLIDKDW